MESSTVLGLTEVVGISLVPVLLVSLGIRLPGWISAWRDRRDRRRSPDPTGPPLESLAADLRRLRPQARRPRDGVAMAKHRGIVLAYDERLVATARALQVRTGLADLPPGSLDREAERLRVEQALTDAGLSWRQAS